MLAPCRKVSRIAFNLDLVVTVSHPQDDKVISPPTPSTNAMRLLCKKILVSPSELFSTRVLDLLQDSPFPRLQIARCISLSILRMCALVKYSLIVPIKKRPMGRFVTICCKKVQFLDCPRFDLFDELSVIRCNKIKSLAKVFA